MRYPPLVNCHRAMLAPALVKGSYRVHPASFPSLKSSDCANKWDHGPDRATLRTRKEKLSWFMRTADQTRCVLERRKLSDPRAAGTRGLQPQRDRRLCCCAGLG